MEILFITHKFPPSIGGMERQSYELVNRMCTRHKTHVIAYTGQGSKLIWFLKLRKKVKEILEANPKIDLIHVNDGLMAASTLWLKKITKIPVIATFHGLDLTFPSSLYQSIIIPKMRSLSGAICVSHATGNECKSRNFDSKDIFVVLNGVDHDIAEIPVDINFRNHILEEKGIDLERKKVIITMGRAVKRKGFSWFLQEVMPHLDQNIVFLMIGPIDAKRSIGLRLIEALPDTFKHKIQLMFGIATDEHDIKKAIINHDLKGRLYHLGKVPFTSLVQYLSIADIFVMPNIKVAGDMEGFGLVALEASLRGCPVLASGIEGITDAVRNGKNGILLTSGVAQEWIDKIHAVLNDKKSLEDMKERAIKTTLEDYGWDKMVEGYEDVFEQIVDNHVKMS